MKTLLLIVLAFSTAFTAYCQVTIGLVNGDVKHHQTMKIRTFFTEGKIVADKEFEYTFPEVAYYENQHGFFRVEPTSTSYDHLKRTGTGLIETYFIVKHNTHYDPNMGWSNNSRRLDYYSYNGEPVMKMNYRNLMMDIGQEPGCRELLKKGKSINTIGIIATVTGVGIIVGSFVSSVSKEREPDEAMGIPAGVWVGAIIAQAPWITGAEMRKKYQQAIDLYNYNSK